MDPLVALSFVLLMGSAQSYINEETASTFAKPSYCRSLDCPVFSVIEKTDAYEARRYEPSKWVSTVVDGFHFVDAQSAGFQRLFKYIGGANEERMKIEMTTPVRTLVTPSDGPYCKTTFTVSFFVPYDLTDSPPAPSNPDVFVEETPAMTVYVTSFGGYMNEADVIQRGAALIETLQEKGIEVETSTYYANGYDSPFRLVGRHNEIWIVSKAAPVS